MARSSNALRKDNDAAAKPAELHNTGRDSAAHPAGALTPAPVGDLDRLIHEKVRLSIVSALAVNPSLTFNELKRLLNASDGNLSVHARKLEEAGYILCNKSFEGRMPKTEYSLSPGGHKAFAKYLDHMEALLHAMRPEVVAAPEGNGTR